MFLKSQFNFINFIKKLIAINLYKKKIFYFILLFLIIIFCFTIKLFYFIIHFTDKFITIFILS